MLVADDGGKLTLEILEQQFPYMGFDTAREYLEWFIDTGNDFNQLWMKLDDGNWFIATITPEVAEHLLKEGEDNGDRQEST